jgi:hypothetical protein
MPIPNYATYLEKATAPYQRFQDTKNSLTTVAGRASSFWTVAPFAGLAPTVPVVPTVSTAGSLGQQNSSGVQRIAQVAAGLANWGMIMLCDRLSHQAGLSGTVTGAQTTNLPTAALTRYTSGNGVMAALEIYSAVGTTATTVTASYTNQNGTDLRTSVATAFGATGFNAASLMIMLPLQEGDTGVRSVESVTLAASTVSAAGNFGVTLFKPLLYLPVPSLGSQQLLFDSVQTLSTYMPVIENNACLFYIICAGTTASGVMQNAIRFIEE